MAEITQTLGFNAQQGIAELNRLEASLNRVNARLTTSLSVFRAFNSNAAASNAAFNSIQQSANGAKTAIQNFNRTKPQTVKLPTSQLNQAGQAAANSAAGIDKFNVSFATLTRVVGTQVIVRALSSVRKAIEGSISGNIDYQKSLAEIQALSPERSLQNLGKAARDVSDDFNVPLQQVTESLREIASDGFKNAEDQTKIFTAAVKLSKLGVSSLADASDLLTGTLNSTGIAIEDVGLLAAKSFSAIDEGKVTAETLRTALARIVPAAKQAGVSLDSVFAAISTETLNNLSPEESATQIRALLQSLKTARTPDLKRVFEGLNVTGIEELTRQTGGSLPKALDAIHKKAQTLGLDFSDLFKNVRALFGGLTLEKAIDKFTELEEKSKKATEADFNSRFQQFNDNSGARLEGSFNRIKNLFTAEIGQNIVDSLDEIIQKAGGIESIEPVIRGFAKGLGIVTVAATTLGTGLFAMGTRGAEAFSLLDKGLAGLGTGLAKLGGFAVVGRSIIEVADQVSNSVIEAAGNSALKDADKIIEGRNAARQAEVDKATEADQAIANSLKTRLETLKSAYDQEVATAQDANNKLVQSNQTTVTQIVSALERLSAAKRRASQQSLADIQDSSRRETTLMADLEQSRFEFGQKRIQNQAIVASRFAQRAEQLASQGSKLLAGAKNKDQERAALSLFSLAQKNAQSAQGAAGDNLGAQFRSQQAIESVILKQVDAEKQLRQAKAQSAAIDARDSAAIAAQLADAKALGKEIVKLSRTKDGDGNPLAETVLTANRDALKKKIPEFQKLINGLPGDASAQVLSSVTPTQIENLTATPKAIDSFMSTLQGKVSDRELVLKFVPDASLFNARLDVLIKAAEDQFDALVQKLAAARKQDQVTNPAQNEIIASRTAAIKSSARSLADKESTGSFFGPLRAIPLVSGTLTGDQSRLLSDTQKAIQGFSLSFQETVRNLEVAISSADPAKRAAFEKSMGPSPSQRLVNADNTANQLASDLVKLGDSVDVTVAQVEALRSRFEASKGTIQNESSSGNALVSFFETNLPRLLEIAQARDTQRGNPSNTLNDTIQATSTQLQQATSIFDEAANKAATSFENAAKRLDAITPRSGKGAAVGRFFAAGTPRGTDNQLAMVGDGEAIINRRNTASFFSQIQAMNAGMKPSFRATGNVTNISVGDINVNEAKSSRATARDVMAEIRRENRRGTGRI